MSHLLSVLAGPWVTHFAPTFVASPPTHYTDYPEFLENFGFRDSRPNFNQFSPSAAIACLLFKEDGAVNGQVWRNDGFNKLSHGSFSGHCTADVLPDYKIGTGTITLNFPDFDAVIRFLMRNQDELVFAHEKQIPRAGVDDSEELVSPMTHGVFRRATEFTPDRETLPPKG